MGVTLTFIAIVLGIVAVVYLLRVFELSAIAQGKKPWEVTEEEGKNQANNARSSSQLRSQHVSGRSATSTNGLP